MDSVPAPPPEPPRIYYARGRSLNDQLQSLQVLIEAYKATERSEIADLIVTLSTDLMTPPKLLPRSRFDRGES